MEEIEFEITYSEYDVINKKIRVKSETPIMALVDFYMLHPDANCVSIKVVEE